MKRITLFLLLALSMPFAAKSAEQSNRLLDVKVNVAAGALTILNPSLEVGFAKQSAITYDYVASFSPISFLNSDSGLLISMSLFSYRHYLKSGSHEGLFLSGDAGLIQYRMGKNVMPFVASDHYNGEYDMGYGYIFGATFGYKRFIGERLSLEVSVSGGYQNSRHEQYLPNGVRIHEFNTTAEWTPYKAGIYLGYRFWK